MIAVFYVTMKCYFRCFFFFQAEDGIRDHCVTGVQTCALPIEALDRLVRADPSDHFREKAVFALFVSKEPKATDTMIEVVRNDSSSRVRSQALFWLAQKAARKTEEAKAASAIRQAIENDPETEVKKKAVFALSQLPKDQGVPLLIQVSRSN